MAISRIDWSTQANRVTPVILIAGVPVVLTAAGVRPTSVSVSSGTIDSLFWPGTGTLTETLPGAGGTFDPVKDLLDANETFEVYEKLDLLKGEVRVEPFTFSLFDYQAQATALVSQRDYPVSQQLASDITASATTIPLVNTAGIPSGYMAAIGRETVTYNGFSGSSLASVTRGKYGSAARVHLSPESHRGLVTANAFGNPCRYWQGRQASVWLCSLSADGLTLSDPTLIFLGTVGAGVQLNGALTKWSIPLDHVTEALGRKLNFGTISLYGWEHASNSPNFHPLRIWSNGIPAITTDALGDPNNGGWHPNLASFAAAASEVCRTSVSAFLRVMVDTNRRLVVVADGTTFDLRTTVEFGWDTARWQNEFASGESKALYSVNPAPTDMFHIHNNVYIPLASDFAKIPTTFEWGNTTPGGVNGTATLSLTADTDNTEGLAATITRRDTAPQRVVVEASLPNRMRMTGAEIAAATRCTSLTKANLGLVAKGSTPIAALMAATKGIAALSGEDLYSTAVDWVGLESVFNSAPTVVSDAREYRFVNGEDTFLSILSDECRLRGLCMVIRHGLISAARLGNFAFNDITRVPFLSLQDYNVVADESGREIPIEVIDCGRPLATSMKFTLPGATGSDPDTVTVTDTTYQEEFGDGETIECKALMSLPMGTDWSGVRVQLFDIAQQVLPGFSEPSRDVRMVCDPRALGAQPGDVASFTGFRIPDWTGFRGVVRAAMVQEVRRSLFGGKMRGTLCLRLPSGSLVAYAPEALVASGGLSAISPVVTLDVTSGWGSKCFFNSTHDHTMWFRVGDAVRLSQFARAPIPDETFTVVSTSTSPDTITLNANPSAAMVAAAVAYGVSIRLDTYGAANYEYQQEYGWMASSTTQLLDGTDAAKRWA